MLLIDGWHLVADSSFTLDMISYRDGAGPGAPSPPFSGFFFVEQIPAGVDKAGRKVAINGPASSIFALRSE